MTSPSPPTRPFLEIYGFTRLFVLAMALVFLHLALVGSLQEVFPYEMSALLVSSLLLLAGFPLLLVRILGQSPRDTFHLKGLRPSTFLLLSLLTVAAVVPIDLLTAWNMRLVPPPDDLAATLAQLQPHGPGQWIIALAAATVAAPLGEEIVFRGMLQQSALGHMAPTEAVLLCAFLFAAVHLQVYALLGLLSVGVIAGVIFLRTRSLTASIYFHGLYNLISLLSLGFGQGEETGLADKPLGLPLAVVGLAVVIWVLRRLGSDASTESTWKTG